MKKLLCAAATSAALVVTGAGMASAQSMVPGMMAPGVMPTIPGSSGGASPTIGSATMTPAGSVSNLVCSMTGGASEIAYQFLTQLACLFVQNNSGSINILVTTGAITPPNTDSTGGGTGSTPNLGAGSLGR